MLEIKNVFILLPLLATIGHVIGDLTEYQLTQVCKDKSMDVLAYPGEINKFIVCINGNAQVGICRSEPDPTDPTQTVQTCFDQSKQSCNLDFCPGTHDPTDYELFVQQYCQDDKNWLARLPAEDCEHFWLCLGSSNAPSYQTCADGMHFSRVSKTCEVALEAGCQSLDSMCKGKPTGYRFASTNCHDYYECRLNKPTARSCPYAEHYDVNSKKCIPAKNSKCVETTVRLPECKIEQNGFYFQHPKCNRFYVCVNTVPLEAQCPQDYVFDEKNQMCKKDTAGICRD